MNRQRRWWPLAGLMACVLGAATGCATSAGSPEAVQGSVSGPIKPRPITWLNSRPSDGPVIKAVAEVAAEYGKSHPGFKLNIVSTPDRPSYLQKVEMLAAAKKLPELFDEDATPFAEKLRKQNRLVDVGNLLEEFGAKDRFRPPALQYQQFDNGDIYGLPLEFAMEYFWYNKEAFQRARLDQPKTLDDFIASCKPLRAKGYIPIALDGKDGWPLERYLAYYPFRLYGNDFVKNLKKGDAKMSDTAGKSGAEFISRLGKAGCFADGFSSAGYTDATDLFTTGKAAMINDGTWDLGLLATDALPKPMRHNVGYFPLPTTPGAVTGPGDYVVSSGIGMAVNSQKFDPLVKDFLKYLVAHYPAKYAAFGQLSPTKDTPTEIPPGATPVYGQVLREADRLGKQTAKPWDTELDPTTNNVVQQNLVLLAQGNMSPREFEKSIDQAVTVNSPRYFAK
ncbi:extracellular solute-binding protein [Streptomyces sp. SID8361]|uniref:ABC transporter substrate-binding protein n=1 Tax=Streptomyces sp. MnatMP-M27 TaxID=1839768 RepID=UPI00081E5514|nr:ABC transporter substrate-binding protein [Streptomyces sp. MnatMP-M27]MYU14501.1 extracellular solute-binding protein [Streptomyces sp. SID8361]SCG06209.1 carbohydrate ABC transporter substrate-binding protein, CUT1 family [Streptomyces sp. MnatMP-M27]